MIPIKITFQSKESLTVYTADPISFTESVEIKPPAEIACLEECDAINECPELEEVKLLLQSGIIILCRLAKEELAKICWIREIASYEPTTMITYAELAVEESELDARFEAVKTVINNLPDLDTRLHLHKEYMKRKRAYVSAIEALLDGVIRRPEQ